jgi:hypothetical protein
VHTNKQCWQPASRSRMGAACGVGWVVGAWCTLEAWHVQMNLGGISDPKMHLGGWHTATTHGWASLAGQRGTLAGGHRPGQRAAAAPLAGPVGRLLVVGAGLAAPREPQHVSCSIHACCEGTGAGPICSISNCSIHLKARGGAPGYSSCSGGGQRSAAGVVQQGCTCCVCDVCVCEMWCSAQEAC